MDRDTSIKKKDIRSLFNRPNQPCKRQKIESTKSSENFTDECASSTTVALLSPDMNATLDASQELDDLPIEALIEDEAEPAAEQVTAEISHEEVTMIHN